MEEKCIRWKQEKDLPVFMYIFLDRIADEEIVEWDETDTEQAGIILEHLIIQAEEKSTHIVDKCMEIIKETKCKVEYELWHRIVLFMHDYIKGETVWG